MARRKKPTEKELVAAKLMALKVSHWVAWQPYVGRYGYIHIAVMMSTIVSMAFTGGAFGHHFFPHDYQASEYVMFALLGGCALMSLCFFLLIRGRPLAVWGLFSMLVLCLSLSLVIVLESGSLGVNWLSFVPLSIGFYLMTTRRYQRGIKVLQVGRRYRERLQELEAGLKHLI